MNLSDSDILELNELCNAVVDGTLNDKQKAILWHWLANSEDARQFYVRVTGLSASLCHYSGEMQTGEPDSHAQPAQKSHHVWRWMFGMLAVAASIALVLAVRPKHAAAPTTPVAESAPDENDFVARLT